MWWSNESFMNQSTLINLHANEYSQKVNFYPFAVNIDIFVGWLI